MRTGLVFFPDSMMNSTTAPALLGMLMPCLLVLFLAVVISLTMTRFNRSKKLRDLQGTEFAVVSPAGTSPDLIVIEKRSRRSPTKYDVTGIYYVVNEVVYQAPYLQTVLASRLVLYGHPTCTYARTRTHTHTYARTHTHMHTHTRTWMHVFSCAIHI